MIQLQPAICLHSKQDDAKDCALVGWRWQGKRFFSESWQPYLFCYLLFRHIFLYWTPVTFHKHWNFPKLYL